MARGRSKRLGRCAPTRPFGGQGVFWFLVSGSWFLVALGLGCRRHPGAHRPPTHRLGVGFHGFPGPPALGTVGAVLGQHLLELGNLLAATFMHPAFARAHKKVLQHCVQIPGLHAQAPGHPLGVQRQGLFGVVVPVQHATVGQVLGIAQVHGRAAVVAYMEGVVIHGRPPCAAVLRACSAAGQSAGGMAAPCPADPGSGLVAGPLAGTLPGSANSGQIACQSSGRNSRRVTAWPHSRSIAAQCSIGVLRPGCFHCQTAALVTPRRSARAFSEPATSAAFSMGCFMHARLALLASKDKHY